ncbi:cilia- and flagella-associated protein 161 [Anguilla anguilla]|uniref:Cilia- and flagella-associated protein 161 n=1 Tax=Anguilla anguilla TaxID=7936 RepID=A0A9D3MKK5_ANGAN|nr:cilia- and flagella-associated protein 161 [Anguilla anguilla]KAG5849040.1 hypothetical protein ANANG_G00105840 [Anguilla anguilla]
MAYIRTYSSRVHIGNWTEDVALEEDTLKDFLDRRERGELTIQKTGLLKQNILKKVDLSVSTDGWLHFGDTVMLVNPGSERRHSASHQQKTPQDPAAIGINADVSGLSANSSIGAPCAVSGTRTFEPSARTAFVITSVDGSPVGETLKYNQRFALRTTNGFAGGLWLESDLKTPLKYAKMSRLQEVSLTDEPSFLSCWNVVYFDPQERLEYEGLPVPVNTKVLIAHCKTNHCLGVLGNYVLWTSFGKEYEVVAQTFLDSHKAECDVNHWLFVTANPGMESQAILDRPDPMANTTATENLENQFTESSDNRLADEKQDM